jgi:adenine-specific DNA-methyltransferase
MTQDTKLPLTSENPTEALLAQLREQAPHLFSEGKVDLDKLKATLGEAIETGPERYGLNWAGKAEAFRAVQTASVGTLLPMPEESVNFDTSENLIIEGDNLEVLKLLQKSYHGQVKMIYIDPPYNTGNEFIYPDNYREGLNDYLRYSGQVSEEGLKQSTNTETSGRFHSKWLNMMYPRLFLARNLLRDDGVIFVSIDDNEVHNLRMLMNEVFGDEQFIGQMTWKNVTDNNPTNITTEHEYIVCYARSKGSIAESWKSTVSDVKNKLIEIGKSLNATYSDATKLQAAYSSWFRENKAFLVPMDRYKYIDQGGVYIGSQSVHNPGREGYRYDVIHPLTKKPCKQPLMGYRFPKESMDRLLQEDRIIFGEDHNKIIELKVYAKEYQDKLSSVIQIDGRLGSYELKELFPEVTNLNPQVQ